MHPAVIEAQIVQLEELARTSPEAIAVVESALIFSTPYGTRGNWRDRFDCVLVVDAPEEVKIARFVDRIAAGRALTATELEGFEADAQRRLQVQHTTVYPGECLGDVEFLEQRVAVVWQQLQEMEKAVGKR